MCRTTDGSHAATFRGVLLAFPVFVVGLSATASAQNATTAGSVTVTSTLNCVSVRASFAGDANANNSVTIHFQNPTRDTGYHTAYTTFIDRRASHGGPAKKYVHQA